MKSKIVGKASKRDKEVWNAAIKAAMKEVNTFDGIIPSDYERAYIVTHVQSRLLYKSLKDDK
jgi:flagellar biosynthesis/type III secretory pathway protein FliH